MQSEVLKWKCADCGQEIHSATPIVFPVYCCCGRKEKADGTFVRGSKPTFKLVRAPREARGPQATGLGDTVAAITKWLGIEPCGGCERRREWLNRVVPYRRD